MTEQPKIEDRKYLLTTTRKYFPTEEHDTTSMVDFLEALKTAVRVGTIGPGESFTIKRKE